MNVMHFKSQAERLAYIKGEFNEIKPIEVSSEPKGIIPQTDAENIEKDATEVSVASSDEKPKKANRKKGKKKDDEVQAE